MYRDDNIASTIILASVDSAREGLGAAGSRFHSRPQAAWRLTDPIMLPIETTLRPQ
jgi:hypothetical protein